VLPLERLNGHAHDGHLGKYARARLAFAFLAKQGKTHTKHAQIAAFNELIGAQKANMARPSQLQVGPIRGDVAS
jgi:hypothetical protein